MTIKDDITAALAALNRPAEIGEILVRLPLRPDLSVLRMKLSELTRAGQLRRVGRGVYALPERQRP